MTEESASGRKIESVSLRMYLLKSVCERESERERERGGEERGRMC